MINSQPSKISTPQARKVSIQDRSVLVGDFIVVNGHKVNRDLLKRQFAQGGYQAQETAHFLLFTCQKAPSLVIVHWFAPETPPLAITPHIAQELQQPGFPPQLVDRNALLKGILDSFQTEEIRVEERSFPIGDILLFNGYSVNLQKLKQRFFNSGYQIKETPHFLYCTREKAPSKILVH